MRVVIIVAAVVDFFQSRPKRVTPSNPARSACAYGISAASSVKVHMYIKNFRSWRSTYCLKHASHSQLPSAKYPNPSVPSV